MADNEDRQGVNLMGTAGDEILSGTSLEDTLVSAAGDDTVRDGDADDTLAGDALNDTDVLLGDAIFTCDDMVANTEVVTEG